MAPENLRVVIEEGDGAGGPRTKACTILTSGNARCSSIGVACSMRTPISRSGHVECGRRRGGCQQCSRPHDAPRAGRELGGREGRRGGAPEGRRDSCAGFSGGVGMVMTEVSSISVISALAPVSPVSTPPAQGHTRVDGGKKMLTRRDILQQAEERPPSWQRRRPGGWYALMQRARQSWSYGTRLLWRRKSIRSYRSSAMLTPSRRASRRTRLTIPLLVARNLPKLVASLEPGIPRISPDWLRLCATLSLAGSPPGSNGRGREDAESPGWSLPVLSEHGHVQG